jgi:hypothetical protein
MQRAPEPDLLLLQDGPTLLVSNRADLVRETLRVQSGSAPVSAMREPEFMAALQAVGSQNVVVLGRGRDGNWFAQGLTWDPNGLHYEHRARMPAANAAPPKAIHRQEIMRSIPEGMALAGYLQTSAIDLRRLLDGSGLSALGGESSNGDSIDDGEPGSEGGGSEPPRLQIPMLPFSVADLLPWIGDEVGLALRGVHATTLAPIPDLALIVAVKDAESARTGLRTLEATATLVTIGGKSHAFTDVPYGGSTFRSVSRPFLDVLTPSHLLDGDVAIIATTRELMQQIIDTRRVGKRHVLTDASFRPFHDFVPNSSNAVLFADPRRVHRAVQQLRESSALWAPNLGAGLQRFEKISVLVEHFPAGVTYIERTPDLLGVRAWMLEKD